MSNNTSKNASDNSAVEELITKAKLIDRSKAKSADRSSDTVPSQNTGEQEKVDLTVVEGGKKTLKERLTSVTEKLKESKKFIYGMGAGAAVATTAFVLFAKSQVEEIVLEDDESEQDSETA